MHFENKVQATGYIRRDSQVDKDSRRGVSYRYPVVDLFAGPGGLGEGFALSTDSNGAPHFNNAVSIERDEFSYQTLLMRHFFRQYQEGEVPDDYYKFLEGNLSREELFDRHIEAYHIAKSSALKISLGPESHSTVKDLIGSRIGERSRWVLVGGPPCQAYSVVGRSRMMSNPEFAQDKRHTLYLEYLKIMADHRPPVFVMENVKGLLSASIEGRSAIRRITEDLSNPGLSITGLQDPPRYRLYSLTQDTRVEDVLDPRIFVVRAEEYGIPQARHRMFIVGIRSDIKVRPKLLEKLDPPTVRDTIGSLPPIRSKLSKQLDSPQAWLNEIQYLQSPDPNRRNVNAKISEKISSEYRFSNIEETEPPTATFSTAYEIRKPAHKLIQSLYDERLTVLTAHEARGHMASDLQRYRFAASFAEKKGRSPRLADFPDSLLPNHKNVEIGRKGKMFADRFRVQLADQVSTTITSHISKDGHYFIHFDPLQCRSLTVREAARLQTFPDNYYFSGPRTSQYHQVGNAVPPMLAKQIAGIVAEVLDSIGDTK